MDIQLDRNRVGLLLTINTLLLHKYTQTRDQNLLKRLHANLTCIGELSERYNNGSNLNKPIFPSILSPPNDSPELVEMYVRLQQLFPDGVQILQRRTLLLRQEQLKRQFQQQQQQQQSPMSGNLPAGNVSSSATPNMQNNQIPGNNQIPNNTQFNQNMGQGQPGMQNQQQSFW